MLCLIVWCAQMSPCVLTNFIFPSLPTPPFIFLLYRLRCVLARFNSSCVQGKVGEIAITPRLLMPIYENTQWVLSQMGISNLGVIVMRITPARYCGPGFQYTFFCTFLCTHHTGVNGACLSCNENEPLQGITCLFQTATGLRVVLSGNPHSA